MATTFEIQSANPASHSLMERVSDWLSGASKSFQMAQMLRALSRYDDAQLAGIGITRSDIPAYAHKIIYRAD